MAKKNYRDINFDFFVDATYSYYHFKFVHLGCWKFINSYSHILSNICLAFALLILTSWSCDAQISKNMTVNTKNLILRSIIVQIDHSQYQIQKKFLHLNPRCWFHLIDILVEIARLRYEMRISDKRFIFIIKKSSSYSSFMLVAFIDFAD